VNLASDRQDRRCESDVLDSVITSVFIDLSTSPSVNRVCREREKFIIRQPPIGGKDDYNSENSWISDGLPSSSRRRQQKEEER